MSHIDRRYQWPTAAGLLLLLLALSAYLYRETLVYLYDIWIQVEQGEYGHGFVVVAISIFLIHRALPQYRKLRPQADPLGAIAVFLAGLFWLVANLASVEMLQALALLILLLALVWTLLGRHIMMMSLFAVGFMIYAIPVWFPLSPVLQEWTADVVFAALRIISIPAFREDNFIVLPAGTISIEEACSGLRFLLAALTLGTLYALLYFDTMKQRLLVVAISAVAALAANFIRVYIIVHLAYATDMQHPMVNDHLTLGWYVFGVILIILLAIDIWIHRGKESTQPEPATAGTTYTGTEPAAINRTAMLAFVMATVSLSVAPLWSDRISHTSMQTMDQAAPAMPQHLGGWRSIEVDAAADWNPVFEGASVEKTSYSLKGDVIIFAEAFYAAQTQGKELISYLNRIYERRNWRSTYSFPRPVQVGGASVLEQQIIRKKGSRKYLIWYWYEVAGVPTTSKYLAKLYQVVGLLRGNSRASARMLVSRIDVSEQESRRALEEFYTTYSQNYPHR